MKKSFTPATDPDDDRTREKALMSKGLGLSYLTPEMVKYHKNDVSRPITLRGNNKVALPRYYRDKIFSESEKLKRSEIFQDYIHEVSEKKLDPLWVQRIRQKENKKLQSLKKTN